MSDVSIDTPLRSYQVDCIPTSKGTVLKRGCLTLFVDGPDHNTAISKTFAQLSMEPMTIRALSGNFQIDQVTVFTSLFRRLLDLDILHVYDEYRPTPELSGDSQTPSEIFYWDMGTTHAEVKNNIAKKSVTFVGANDISMKIADITSNLALKGRYFIEDTSLSNYGESTHKNYGLALRPTTGPKDGTEIIVASSMFGNVERLLHWNEFAKKHDAIFIPILLSDLTAKIGPVYQPRDGGPCYCCFVDRQRSAIDLDVTQAAIFSASSTFQRKTMSHTKTVTNFIATVAATVLDTAISGHKGNRNGSIIDVRPLIPSVVHRRVLKTPRCPVCSRFAQNSQISDLQ